jgi:hypothetical protein
MSARQEELITEEEALRYLQITPERLKSMVSKGLLKTIDVQSPGGEMIFYYRGQIESLKEQLRWEKPESEGATELEVEEWPDVIGE